MVIMFRSFISAEGSTPKREEHQPVKPAPRKRRQRRYRRNKIPPRRLDLENGLPETDKKDSSSDESSSDDSDE
jgi:hypothetical protein